MTYFSRGHGLALLAADSEQLPEPLDLHGFQPRAGAHPGQRALRLLFVGSRSRNRGQREEPEVVLPRRPKHLGRRRRTGGEQEKEQEHIRQPHAKGEVGEAQIPSRCITSDLYKITRCLLQLPSAALLRKDGVSGSPSVDRPSSLPTIGGGVARGVSSREGSGREMRFSPVTTVITHYGSQRQQATRGESRPPVPEAAAAAAAAEAATATVTGKTTAAPKDKADSIE